MRPLVARARAAGALVVDMLWQRPLDEHDVRLHPLRSDQEALSIEKPESHWEETEEQNLEKELEVAQKNPLSLLLSPFLRWRDE